MSALGLSASIERSLQGGIDVDFWELFVLYGLPSGELSCELVALHSKSGTLALRVDSLIMPRSV